MVYAVEGFRPGQDQAWFGTLAEAREEARSRLGVASLNDDMRGDCPDEDDLTGIESWLGQWTDNETADAEAAVYILSKEYAAP